MLPAGFFSFSVRQRWQRHTLFQFLACVGFERIANVYGFVHWGC